MRGYIHAVRPAGAAIAAVLALGSTMAGAQEAPAGSTPIIVPPPVVTPAAPTPAAPTVAPAQPMVQQVPSVEERLAAARAASEAETTAAAPQASPRRKEAEPRRTQPSVQEATSSGRAKASPAPVARPSAPLAKARDAAPAAARDASAPTAAPMAASAPQQRAAPAVGNSPDTALLWAVGGGTLLLAGLGGAALMRRRKRPLEDREEWADGAAESHAAAPITAAPAPRHSMPSPVAASGAGGTLEDMVAAPPTPENPFRTHKKRLARARFLLARQEQQSAARHAPAVSTPPPQTIHAEPQMQTVYRLGSGQGNRMGYKPQTR